MTFQQLQYLLDIYRTGSFSAAAKEHYITQSTISNALLSLETELGRRIFIRNNNNLIPTPEGRQIIEYAKRICDIRKLLTNSAQANQPQLRIGAPEYAPAQNAFTRFVEETAHRNDITLSYCNSKGRSFINMIINNEIDLGVIRTFSPNAKSFEKILAKNNISYQPLATIPTAICIGTRHPLYTEEAPKFQDFSDGTMIESPDQLNTSKYILSAYLNNLNGKSILCNSNGMRNTLLNQTSSYAVVSMPTLQEREGSTLRYVPIPDLMHVVYAIYDPIQLETPEVARYLTLLKEEVAAAKY